MQRLTWDTIRARATEFAAEWSGATYERGETQSFYNDFFQIFGVKRRSVADYEKRVETLDKSRSGFIDLFWPRKLIVEQKSAGLRMSAALSQVLDYVDWLPERDRPRFVLTCDFQRWRLWDRETGAEINFTLQELPKHITAFAFILGRQETFTTQAAVNIDAAELMGTLHDALAAANYTGHDLERLLVRLLFCLFADSTGIFEPSNIFLQLIDDDTQTDGGDVGRTLIELFDTLDTPPAARQRLPAELDAFPYVNGALFSGSVRTPRFDSAMREMLLEAARFDWSKVSPAIFGSLFQSVMNKAERRAKGAHYTSETNIMKVIGPLFLDDLRAELMTAIARRTGREGVLQEFQRKLARLNFLDPACGCGNFLVVAYRELRALERECLEALYPRDPGSGLRQGFTDLALLAMVDVGQFHGIELEEFPARIAEVAMWMTDHIANNALAAAFSSNFARIPLKQSANIRTTADGRSGDALIIDWNDVLPAAKCAYVMGNPPFAGFVMRRLAQQDQAGEVMKRLGAAGSRLDYVAAWFLKAAQYIQQTRIGVAFVATNSLSQGEQVAQLWPAMFARWNVEITFAHRTFVWTSEARGKAHVHVVVIGFTHRANEPESKRLFSYADAKKGSVESRHTALTAYLFDARLPSTRHLVVERASIPMADVPAISVGTKPVDGGHYIFDAAERRTFLDSEPRADQILSPFLGGHEFINGDTRWLLTPAAARPEEISAMPQVVARIERVRAYRETATGKLAQSLARVPQQFHTTVLPTSTFLVIPEVSSERREYVPIGWIEPPTIPSNKLMVIRDATPFLFGILTSRMHMAWLSHIGGRLKSDFSYSSGLVYNTFPWPAATDAQRAKVGGLADAVLAARANHPMASLAVLYDPLTMPADLRAAHAVLDRAVDRLYRTEAFVSGVAGDRDRVEHLFSRYTALVDPLATAGVKANKRVARAVAKKTAAL